jgi:(p)ppGpp synthase/HD superfamily hydrolase
MYNGQIRLVLDNLPLTDPQLLRLIDAVSMTIIAHDSIKQVRKYTGEAYWTHPLAVAQILIDAGETNLDVIFGALFHDIPEDVAPKNPAYKDFIWDVEKKFGKPAALFTLECKNRYTKERFPKSSRAERKHLETERLSETSFGAIKIKLADILHNTESIIKHDPIFAVTYLNEKLEFLNLLAARAVRHHLPQTEVFTKLYAQVNTQIEGSLIALTPKMKNVLDDVLESDQTRKSSDDWVHEYNVTVLDPDGWDRSVEKFEASWNELITRDEFEKRLSYSTVSYSDGFFDKVLAGFTDFRSLSSRVKTDFQI